MLLDNDKDIIRKEELLTLRTQNLREFLTDWFKEENTNLRRTQIQIREIVRYNSHASSYNQCRITFPLNYQIFDIQACIDSAIEQLFEKIPDIHWEDDICKFEYREVHFTITDYTYRDYI